MNQSRVAAVLGIALLMSSTSPVTAQASCGVATPIASRHVRPLDPLMAEALRDGLRRSPTLAALVQRIDELDGVVYFEGRAQLSKRSDRPLLGSMSHAVSTTPAFRVIRIFVTPSAGNVTIATLGHELRHAIEVLEDGGAVDVATVGLLYDRIGRRTRTGVYETNAAQQTGDRVMDELVHCRR